MIWEDNKVLAIPGLAPQVYPYVLILPKRHVISWTQMDEDENESFIESLHWLMSRGPLIGDNLLIAEHSGIFPEGSCMEHCHLHVVKALCSVDLIFGDEFDTIPFTGNRLKCCIPYVMAAIFNGREFIGKFVENSCGGNQFFRRKLADCCGINWWNWQDRKNSEWMIQLYNEYNDITKKSSTNSS